MATDPSSNNELTIVPLSRPNTDANNPPTNSCEDGVCDAKPEKNPNLFDNDPCRGNWAYFTEFSHATIAHAVGMRHICLLSFLFESASRFGLLVLIYFLLTATIYRSILETGIGQFSSTGFISAFRVSPLFKGVGYTMLFLNLFEMMYLGTVVAYPLAATLRLVDYVTPWVQNSTVNMTVIHKEYFESQIKKLDSGWTDIFEISTPVMLCALFSWIMVGVFLVKGVRAMGKIIYGTALTGIFFLIIVSIKAATLFFPKVDHLPNEDTWGKVLGSRDTWFGLFVVTTFALGQGHGILIAMSSFNRFREKRASHTCIPCCAIFVNLLAVLIVQEFGNYMRYIGLGHIDFKTPNTVNYVFVLFPDFVRATGATMGWAYLFYLALFLLEFHSILIQSFAILSSLFDEYPFLRLGKSVVTVVYCILFAAITIGLGSLGLHVPCDMFLYVMISCQMVTIILTVIAFCYSYTYERLSIDWKFMSLAYIEKCGFNYAIPIGILITAIMMFGFGYPPFFYQFGMFASPVAITFYVLCFLPIPYVFIKRMRTDKMPFKAIFQRSKPEKWHPADIGEQVAYFDMKRATEDATEVTVPPPPPVDVVNNI